MKKMNIGTIVPSLEAIDFQSDAFGKEIENVFQSMFDNIKTDKEAQDSKEREMIEKIVFNRTGCNIDLVFDTQILAAIYIPTFNKNHIFYANETREYFEKWSKERGEHKALKELIKKNNESFIDLKTAKVGGVFSKLKYSIHIQYSYFKAKGYTAASLAAIFMHELGHLFTVLEMTSRTVTTNQILAYICKSVTDKLPADQMKVIIEESEKALKLKQGDLKEIYEQTNPLVISTVFLKKNSEHVQSQSGLYGYDLVSCEQMADQFVSRFGYGRHLIEGLDKLGKDMGAYQTKKKAAFLLFTEATCMLVLYPALIFGLILSGVGAGLGLIFGVLYMVIWWGNGSMNTDHTYDTMVVRPTRMKNDMMQALKDPKLDKETIKIITQDIKIIESLINQYQDHIPSMTRIKDYFMKSHRDARDAKILQNDLENLAANKLFLQSAQLKTI